jgi:hypothetical protein
MSPSSFVELDLELLGRERKRAEDAEPAPARLTAATTSRQWLKAKIGNSTPNRSHSRVCVAAPIDRQRVRENYRFIFVKELQGRASADAPPLDASCPEGI